MSEERKYKIEGILTIRDYQYVQGIEQQNKQMREALEEILQEPCPLDDINVNRYFEDTSIKPCKDICPLHGNGKCPYRIAQQALTQIEKR